MKMNRRDFLKGAAVTGALAAGSTLAGFSPALAAEDKAASEEKVTSEYLTAESAKQKWAFEVAPDPITDIDEVVDADVVVVGAGTAGLVTAYSALQEGLDVVVVTASSVPISRGGSNNAIYSKQMEKEGFERQKPYYILKEMAENSNNVDQRKWYKYYHNSEEAMNWMIDIMEDAGYQTAIERTSNMAEDSLFYQAPAAHGWINDENKSVGMTQPFVVNTLSDKIQEEGGQVFFKNIGRQLVRGDEPNGTSGRVTGVICEREDGTYAQYNGSKAVVLATGDFSSNRDMMAKYAPQAMDMVSDEVYDNVDYDKEFVFGGLYPGDGQRMGLWVGAAWQKTFPCAPMGATINAGTTPNAYQNFWGLLVNRDGQRFMNEYCSNILGGRAQTLQPGGESFAIWDVDYSNLPDWYAGQGGYGILEKSTPEEVVELWEANVESGLYIKGDTLEEVLEKVGLPVEETMATINRYNEMCEAREDTDFFKRSENLFPIKTAPFYANKASGTPGILTILGGLRTDDNMRVCDADDNPIEGLYNVGTMIGDFYSGFYTFQVEGVNYGACCLTFGYLTGKFIAENGDAAPASQDAADKDVDEDKAADKDTGETSAEKEDAAAPAKEAASAEESPDEEAAGVDCSPCHGDAHKPGEENPHGY